MPFVESLKTAKSNKNHPEIAFVLSFSVSALRMSVILLLLLFLHSEGHSLYAKVLTFLLSQEHVIKNVS